VGLVKVESSEGITTITMTRADKRNALNQQLCDELLDAYTAFEAGSDLVAVLQADGPAFLRRRDLQGSAGRDVEGGPACQPQAQQAGDRRHPGLGDRRRHLHGHDL
jgi:enoyl-CoA hydratase/carnithine racemase